MGQQSIVQRWCTVVLLAVWLSMLLYYGLPAMAYRAGRAFEAGRYGLPHDPVAGADRDRSSAGVFPGGVSQGADEMFRAASQRVQSAVVRVGVLRKPHEEIQPHDASFSNAPRMADFQSLEGAGLIIDKQGHVLTSHRVVSRAVALKIMVSDHAEPYLAHFEAADPATDLAIVKLDSPPDSLPVADFYEGTFLEPGEYVIAIGAAYSSVQSLCVGLVVSCGREFGPACCQIDDLIQTAAANPWTCGGPLLNLRGEIVGINTAFVDPDGAPSGFAVPAGTAREVYRQLVSRGVVARGWLGLFMHPVDPKAITGMDDVAGGSPPLGVAIDWTVPDSPSNRAGLKPGDLVVAYAGRDFSSTAELRERIAATPPGQRVALTVWRAGKKETVYAEMGRMPDKTLALPGESEWGVRLMWHQPGAPIDVDRPSGDCVVIESIVSSRAASELRRGDEIIAINDSPVTNLADYCRAVVALEESPRASGGSTTLPAPVRVTLRREGTTQTVFLGLKGEREQGIGSRE
jgi:serine protease Do